MTAVVVTCVVLAVIFVARAAGRALVDAVALPSALMFPNDDASRSARSRDPARAGLRPTFRLKFLLFEDVPLDAPVTRLMQSTPATAATPEFTLNARARLRVPALKTVWITSSTQTQISHVVIMSFGNGMCLENDAAAVAQHVIVGNPKAAVVCWDYRGVGLSGGRSSVAALERDARSVCDAVTRRIAALQAAREMNATRISLACWGHSLGTHAATIMAASSPLCSQLVLSAPFASFADVSVIPALVGSPRVSPVDLLPEVFAHIAIVFAGDDTLFPPQVHVGKIAHVISASAKRKTRNMTCEFLQESGGHNSADVMRSGATYAARFPAEIKAAEAQARQRIAEQKQAEAHANA